ncbi:hypothetical protein NP233_g980 [Leucocoprinus birnbaumii]|uniref:Uncharacterized protein n=1 Tax=Leucocoprinus birnbaumii TaxID=56174 RepID=A0AAD5YZW5_9AGAR|nr:hypothetical protein NP233_g980 [Leucocoprinus birnbaumii]
MSKTLSNGTLSLRFMQNALRRQQLQEVELERAEVKDEGKWEVGQDVKEAWGIGREQTSELVAHESSYLPFLFSETNDTRNTKPRGRRMFNKKGLDVSQEQPESQPKQVITFVIITLLRADPIPGGVEHGSRRRCTRG